MTGIDSLMECLLCLDGQMRSLTPWILTLWLEGDEIFTPGIYQQFAEDHRRESIGIYYYIYRLLKVYTIAAGTIYAVVKARLLPYMYRKSLVYGFET